jgi:ankyrin repeat protein
LRHLLDCWKSFAGFSLSSSQELAMTELSLRKRLELALQDMETCATELESQQQYAEAQYLYRRISNWSDRESPCPQHTDKYLKTLAALCENMGDFPAAEDIKEKIVLLPVIFNNETLLKHELEDLIRLYTLFYERIEATGNHLTQFAKTSIFYRAIALDNISLYGSLVDKGLVPQADIIARIPLLVAAEKNATRLAGNFLDSGIAIDYADGFEQNALHKASKNGCKEMVQLLLQRGANVNALSGENLGDGKSALLWAAASGDKEIVQLLLDAGADINRRAKADSSGRNALEEAVIGGYTAVLHLLLQNGANTEGTDSQGRTALHLAVESGNVIAAQILLDSGIDIGVLTAVLIPGAMVRRRLPFHRAVLKGLVFMVQLLIRYGIDINAKENDDWDGRTALHCAAKSGNVKLLSLLLEAGADVNACSGRLHEETALRIALKGRNKEIVQLLLENGADIDAKFGHFEETPLHRVVRSGYEDMLEVLLEAGAKIEARNGRHQTALILAAAEGREKMVQLLLRRGASVDSLDDYRRTALILSVMYGYEEVFVLLLKAGADIEAKTEDRTTVLSLAVFRGNERMVRLLLEHGADTKARNKDGWTALQMAVRSGYEDMMRLLLEYGSDIGAKDRVGRTARDDATYNGNGEIVQLLDEVVEAHVLQP